MQGQTTVCSTVQMFCYPCSWNLQCQFSCDCSCNQYIRPSATSDQRKGCSVVCFFLSFKGTGKSEETKWEESNIWVHLRGRHGYTAGRREEGRGGQKIIFYFVLEKSYEKSKLFLFEREETIHSSEVHGELVHSLSKRWTGWTDSASSWRFSENTLTASLCISQESTCRRIVLSTYTSTTNNEPARCYHYFPTKAQQRMDVFQM